MKSAHHANFCGYQVGQSVEPFDISLQVTRFSFAEETLKNKSSKVSLKVIKCPYLWQFCEHLYILSSL